MKSRIRMVLLPLAALFILLAGCSKDTTNNPRPEPFGQSDADDIAQQLGASLGSDAGGWFYELLASMEQRAATGDTAKTVVQGGMTHVFSWIYTDSVNNVKPTWDLTVADIDGFDHASGTLAVTGTAGTFRHWSDFLASGGHADTTVFSTLSLDTTLCAIQSFFRGDSAKWYITTFYDYDDVKMFKDNVTEPFPRDGLVAWLIEARQLNSLDPSDVNRTLLVEASLQFNGTQMVPATVFEFEDDPRTHFHYWVDLKTGQVSRR